jgi:hypothetical protein
MTGAALSGGELWVPQSPFRNATVDECVEGYRDVLRALYPGHLKAFDDRRGADADSAVAEAVVYSLLRAERLEPVVAEVLGSGGPDFLCLHGTPRAFFVEATSLEAEAIVERSSWPNEIAEQGVWFSEVTRNLCNKASQKARQLSGLPHPRVLVVCSTHIGAGVLLGPLAAEDLMTPDLRLAPRPGMTRDDAERIADLSISPFLLVRDGELVPIRRSISAILLVSIGGEDSGVVGMLHPAPVVPLDYTKMQRVPFLRLVWPPEIIDGQPRTEWVVGNPDARLITHRAVVLSDAEMRGSTSLAEGHDR